MKAGAVVRAKLASVSRRIDRDDVRRFASVVDPDGAAGTRMVLPFFLVTLLAPLFEDPKARATLGAVPELLLHAAQDMRFAREIELGEAVFAEYSLTDVVPYGLHRGLVIDGTVSGPSGERLADMRSVLVDRGTSAPVGIPPERDAVRRMGEPLAERALTVTTDLPDRYAMVSGDRNPLHLDAAVAAAAGLPGVIAHGLAVFSLAFLPMVGLVEMPSVQLKRVRARFSRPVVPGSELSVAMFATDRTSTFGLRVMERDGHHVLRDASFAIDS